MPAAVAAMLLAGGCGSSESSADAGEVTVETGSLSKAEFVKRADAICIATRAQYDKRYETFLERNGSAVSQDRANALGKELVETVIIPTFETDVDQISALGAPEGDEEMVSSFLAAIQEQLDQVREDPSKLTGNLLAKPAKLAQAYGLIRCAKSLS